MLKTYCSDELAKAVTPHRSVKSNTAMLKTTGDAEAKIIATACAATSVGRARWTISTISLLTHEMALILEEPLRCTTIGRVLRRNNLRHHLSEYWCILPKEDADFVAHMEDILEVYQRPYDPE